MTSLREKYLAAMRRTGSGYVPFSFWLCPGLLDQFRDRTGRSDYWEYYGFAIRGVTARFIGDASRFAAFHPELPDLQIQPEWGYAHEPGDFEHFTRLRPSAQGFAGIHEFETYPFPEPAADYDWDGLAAATHGVRQRGLVAVAGMAQTIFETAWHLRGMENFLMDLLEAPELVEWLLERITTIRCDCARRYADAGCDVLALGDDVATQRGMMLSATLWRERLKPRLARVIRAAKDRRPDILVNYHSDGRVTEIIPDLIEIGVDILNPVQPECMDPAAVKRQFGNQLSFAGTIGTQTTMPFATPDEVRAVCAQRIREVGGGGGLSLAPTHTLEPEVPWANIEAFLQAVTDHNRKCPD